MRYRMRCSYCGLEFETDDIDLDACSMECFEEDRKLSMERLLVEDERLNEIGE